MMVIMKKNWTRPEFKAYLLLFAANANFYESKKELDFIKKRVGEKNLEHVHEEFEADNDYQRIQKIEAEIERLEYGAEEIENLMADIKGLFMSDGGFDILEENLFRGLRHLLLD